MIVYHAGGLHERIANRGTYKTEAAFLQSFAHGVGFHGSRGHIFWSAACVPQRSAARELPDVSVEASEFALHGEKRLGVRNGGGDFQAISNNSRIGQQSPYFSGIVLGNFRSVKAIENLAVTLAFTKDRLPAQTGLRAFGGLGIRRGIGRHAPVCPTPRRGSAPVYRFAPNDKCAGATGASRRVFDLAW